MSFSDSKISIAIGSDHGGFDMKQELISYLQAKGRTCLDCGPMKKERCDYPDYAVSLCQKITSGDATCGVLVCGTGIGMSIAANKIPGIRCGLVHDHYTARMCREHNNANVLALGARVIGDEVAKECVDAFLAAEHSSDGTGRHGMRVAKINALDKS